jgi:hypothetical protein
VNTSAVPEPAAISCVRKPASAWISIRPLVMVGDLAFAVWLSGQPA